MSLSKNEHLRALIMQRLEELDWRAADLLRDAEERKHPINRSLFSKWRNRKKPSLGDNDLLWIMERLGIRYNLNFGSPVIKEGKLSYEIGKFDELEALRRINILFKKK